MGSNILIKDHEDKLVITVCDFKSLLVFSDLYEKYRINGLSEVGLSEYWNK